MAESEFILLKRFSANGDAEAFAQIIRQHAPMVYGVCLRILENKDKAADAVQDTFLQLVHEAAGITGSLPNWLHKVATSRAIDLVRSDSKRRQRELIYTANSENVDSEDNKASWREISGFIDEELDNLDELTREVLILHFFENQTMTFIGEKFGISQQTVSRRIESGIVSLRQNLKSRGIIVPAAILTALLTENIVTAAPASIMKELGKIALAGSKTVTPATIISGMSTLKVIITAVIMMTLVVPGLFVFNSNSSPKKEMSNEDLLNFLIEQNEAARDKIKTAEYDVSWTSFVDIQEGRRQNNATGHVKRKGKWRYSTYENDASIPVTGWQQKQSANMAINDNYLAYWPSIGNPIIYKMTTIPSMNFLRNRKEKVYQKQLQIYILLTSRLVAKKIRLLEK